MSAASHTQIDLFIDPSAGTIPGPRALERQKKVPLPDDPARDRIEHDLEASLFVEAAAGAGKTTALVRRLVALIGSGKGTLEGIIAVTFTDKAAGEMKLRLRTAIEEARQGLEDPAARAPYDRAVRQLEAARIGTIHSFCADLLRERPVEAGVDPKFQVLPEEEAGRLLDRAFQDWFEETLADPPEGVRRVLRRPPERVYGGGWRGPRQELRDAAQVLVDHRDFPAAWQRPEGFAHAEAIDRAVAGLRDLAAFDVPGPEPRQWIAKGFRKIARFVERLDLREEDEPRDPDRLEAELRELAGDRKAGWTYSGSGQWYDRARGLRLEDVKARRDEVKAELDAILQACEADLAARLREELRPVVDRYEALKRREGALDFLDLLLRTRDLVVQHDDVRGELQRRFTHFFVDEFQDTDPLQAEILLLLAADDPDERDFRAVRPLPGKLFLVGDPKQSIYSFRRADVRLYEETKRRLAERGTELVRLTTSFRSVPWIQETVNAAFSEGIRPAEDGSQATYVPLERFRDATEGQPAVIALPAPAPYADWGRTVKWRISESYADAVCAFVKWLVEESGWSVTEPGLPHHPVPLRPRHVCILSRRLQSRYEEVMGPYVRGLEARGVPHVLVGGKGFHDREEILALRNALQAIEWPDDPLSVYATLRGPFFAFTDAELLEHRERAGGLHPLRVEEEAAGGSVAEALGVIAELHRARNRRPIAETLTRFLSACRAHAGIAIWPAGEQALANCLRLVDRARSFERDGAPSFRAFVERLEAEAERGEAENAPIVEEGTEGVRIMSVHRSKGLEFAVVILADPTCNATFSDPSSHVDAPRGLWAEKLCGAVPSDVLENRDAEAAREEAEAVRLAYVAATRARDLLVVPALGDGDGLEGWAQYLNPAIYPESEARRAPEPVEYDLPEFGEDTVVERPPRADGRPEDAVKPGLHRSAAGPAVLWWDPATLDLGRREPVGLRQREILAADESGVVSSESVRAHQAWRDRREAARAAGAAAEVRVRTVKARAAEVAAEAPREEPEEVPPERPAEPSPEPPPEVRPEPDVEVEVEVDLDVVPEPEPPEPGPPGRGSEGETDVEVEVVVIPRPEGSAAEERPGGSRFGDLVHRVLAAVELDADAEAVRRMAEAQARVVGASAGEAEGAAAVTLRALTHPLLRRAADRGRAGALRREAPLFAADADGAVTEGVADLAFREEDGAGTGRWTVVDFKTDRAMADEDRALYVEQVRLYARAVSRATGEPARGVLLVI